MTALILAAALAAAPKPALGTDLVIEHATRGPVVALIGSIEVRADVVGDVVAVAGDVTLAAGTRVEGDVVALGGRVIGTGTASGRVFGLAGPAILAPVRLSGHRRELIGAMLVRSGAWIVAMTLLLVVAPRLVREGGEVLTQLGARSAVAGVGLLTAWLALVFLALAVGSRPAARGLVLLAVGAFLIAKLVGLTVVAWWFGLRLRAALPDGLRAELPRTGLAAIIMVSVGVLPVVGTLLWTLVSVAGMGACVVSLVPHAGPAAVSAPAR